MLFHKIKNFISDIFDDLSKYIGGEDTFIKYMKSQGKLGGQNKVSRLSNDRHIANELNKWIKR